MTISPRYVKPTTVYETMDRLLVYYDFNDGEGLLLHDHPYSHDICVLGGTVTVSIGDAMEKTLSAGERISFPHGAVHGLVANGPARIIAVFNLADVSEFANS